MSFQHICVVIAAAHYLEMHGLAYVAQRDSVQTACAPFAKMAQICSLLFWRVQAKATGLTQQTNVNALRTFFTCNTLG